QQTVTDLIRDKAPAEQIQQAQNVVTSRQTLLKGLVASYKTETDAGKNAVKNAKTNRDAAQKAYDQAKTAYDKAVERAQADGGAFEVRPDDTVSAEKVIADLCSMTGVEWTTRTVYSDDIPDLYVD